MYPKNIKIKKYLLARVPEAPALWRPNFLMMKLDPIKAPETKARMKPMRLLVMDSEA